MAINFGFLDFFAVATTLIATALIGIYFGRKNKTNEDLLLGGRKINLWPVALSVMASCISAVTVIGFPAEVFAYGIEIFNTAVVDIIFFPISIAIFVPFLYPMKLTSMFQYLELRFKCRTLRKLLSGIYIFEQLCLAGVILYGPSLVLDIFLDIPTWVSIFGIGVLCTLYTATGGISAVVWTDALQAIIMFAGMSAIMIKAFINAGGIYNAFSIAEENGRMDMFKFKFDIFQRHNFFNFYLGFTFLTLFRSTIHQQQFQRYSSQPTLKDAKKAMNLSIPVTLGVKVVSVLTGIAVFAFYHNCDPVKLGKTKTIDHVIPYFVVTEMSQIPGILGLFVACIFSGVLSSISSTINCLTAVTWEDFLSDLRIFERMDAKGQANVCRVTGFLYGLTSVALAFSAQYMGSVYAASYQVIGASSGVILSIFMCGCFVRYVNATGAKIGAAVSFSTMLGIGIRSIFSEILKEPTLPTSVDGCKVEQLASLANSTKTLFQAPAYVPPEWPEKIFAISYLIFPLIGAILTIILALCGSLCSGGFKNGDLVPEEYLHPFVRKRKVEENLQNGSSFKETTTLETLT